jgi:solute carrier family 25 (mitochondrial S-adenosylmethionine transporter), member 26
MQAAAPLSKFGKLVPPPGARGPRTWSKRALLRHGVRFRNRTAVALSLSRAAGELGSLYQGVFGAASGAGIIIGTYFAFYSTAKKALARAGGPDGPPGWCAAGPGGAAFLAGSAAAAGSSVVKVPLAVCIRSVQAGVYPNVFAAASSITRAAGVRGLFTGFVPTLLEDVPDMGVKFAVYEALRAGHAALVGGTRPASAGEDFAMGAAAGAVAAAATTPLDVVKTNMMCSAASRPSMAAAARDVLARSGPGGLFAGVGPRALSNGLNSAVFFCLFEAIRSALADAARARESEAMAAGEGKAKKA